jgi:hypothetical protein
MIPAGIGVRKDGVKSRDIVNFHVVQRTPLPKKKVHDTIPAK